MEWHARGCLPRLGRHDLDLATGTVTVRQNHGGGGGKEDPVDAEVKGIAAIGEVTLVQTWNERVYV